MKTKKLISILITLVMVASLIAVPTNAFAADTTEGYFTVNADGTLIDYDGPDGNVEIPETVGGKNVTGIGKLAFQYTDLTSVTIPKSVKKIDDGTFAFKSQLARVTVMAAYPPTLGTNVFKNCSDDLKIYVPKASVYMYTHYNWTDYADRITAIHNHSFSEEWTIDETHHWHVCTQADCDIEDYAACGLDGAAYGEHYIDKSTGKCVCGITHLHSFSTGWHFDEIGHWHYCTEDGCDIEDYATCGRTGAAYGKHSYNEYGICVCGASTLADFKQINELINEYKALDKSLYSKNSWAKLENAVSSYKTARMEHISTSGGDYLKEDQATIDYYADLIRNAIADLTPKCAHPNMKVNYVWNDAHTECTAIRECDLCGDDIDPESATKITVETVPGKDCTEEGTITYTATFATLAGDTVTVPGGYGRHNFEEGKCTLCGASCTYLKFDGFSADGESLYTEESIPEDAKKITSSEDTVTLGSGWYVVSEDADVSKIKVGKQVNIILIDGYTLTVQRGIEVTDGTLNIYGQKEDTGAIFATGDKKCAGIGGPENCDCGFVTVYGGTVTAVGGDYGVGIGGGWYGDGGRVRIHGGNVTAVGGEYARGIGSGLGGREKGGLALYSSAHIIAGDDENTAARVDEYNGERYVQIHPNTERSLSGNGAETHWCKFCGEIEEHEFENHKCACGQEGYLVTFYLPVDNKPVEIGTQFVVIGTQYVVKGGKVKKPADPTKPDNTFLCWCGPIGNVWDFENDVVTGDLELRADFTDGHSLIFGNDWAYDENAHWHPCLQDNCNIKNYAAFGREGSAYAKHDFDETGKCKICGASHEHSFSEEWTYDETGHWHYCTADGCTIKDYSTCGFEGAAYAKHDLDETGKCKVCGAPHTHTFSSYWDSDNIAHWHYCKEDDCNIIDYSTCGLEGAAYGKHDFDETGKCKICKEYNSADFTQINECLDIYVKLISTLYTDETWTNLQNAVTAYTSARAEYIINTGHDYLPADQATVDDFAYAILKAMESLKWAPADYSGVNRFADIYNAKKAEKDNYIPKLWDAVEAAYNQIEWNLDSSEQGKVNFFARELENAINALKLKPADYSRVDDIVSIYKVMKLGAPPFASEWWFAAEDAYNTIEKGLVRDLDFTNQEWVDSFAPALENAIKNYEENEPADYSRITELGDIFQEKKASGCYTAESLKLVQDEFNDVDYTVLWVNQSIVNAYADAIENAMDALEYLPADYSAVNALIDAWTSRQDTEDFTTESVLAVKAAIDEVDWNIDCTEQGKVDAYAEAIENAIKALEYKKTLDLQIASDGTFTVNAICKGAVKGIIVVALYADKNAEQLVGVKVFDLEKGEAPSNISFDTDGYIKAMWLSSLSDITPLCDAKGENMEATAE